MSIITLTSDFGYKDPDIGHLKGLILQEIPQANFIDITHDLTPFCKEENVYIIKNALATFPEKTIHLVAVESETSEQNTPMLFVSNNQYYFGNNNGLIATALSGKEMQVYKLTNEHFDNFMQTHIKAIGNLLKGMPIEKFATKTDDFKNLKLPVPSLKYEGNSQHVSMIAPKVIYNDRYGNAIFNLTKQDFEKWREGRKVQIKINYLQIDKIIDGYSGFDRKNDQNMQAGNVYTRFNDYGYLEVFAYQSNIKTGNAKTLLGLKKDQPIIINFL